MMTSTVTECNDHLQYTPVAYFMTVPRRCITPNTDRTKTYFTSCECRLWALQSPDESMIHLLSRQGSIAQPVRRTCRRPQNGGGAALLNGSHSTADFGRKC